MWSSLLGKGKVVIGCSSDSAQEQKKPLPVFPLCNSSNSHFLKGLIKEDSKAEKW